MGRSEFLPRRGPALLADPEATAAAAPTTGWRDITALTPYATDDASGTTYQSGSTIFNVTLQAGALQTFDQGYWAFFELPTGIEGNARDINKAILTLFADFWLPGGFTDPYYGAYAVGLVSSAGGVGSGPGGAPAAVSEIDAWVIGGVQDRGRDPLLIRDGGILQVDSSGSVVTHERDRVSATFVAAADGGMNMRNIYCQTLRILAGEWAAVAGSAVTQNLNTVPWSPGDKLAIAAGVWRDNVNADPVTITWRAEMAYTQDTEPPA